MNSLVWHKAFNEHLSQYIENTGCESKSRSLMSVITQDH